MLVFVALFGWPFIALILSSLLPERRAAAWLIILPTLFLPVAGYYVPGFIYDKLVATGLGAALAIAITHGRRIGSFRPSIFDMFVVALCGAPLFSTFANGLPVNDGVVPFVHNLAIWLVPYLIGRVYLADNEGLRELAFAMVVGGLIYAPLCLYEIRMSPQLSRMIYGFAQHEFIQTKRFGGWRPMVFMQHGLMVGLWMCMTALVAWTLWRGRILRILRGAWGFLLVIGLLITAVLCKSTGAIVLMLLGLSISEVLRRWPRTWVVIALIAVPLLYMGTRITGDFGGEVLVNSASSLVDRDRAMSLKERIDSEDDFIGAAMRQPLFGWRHWGRTAPYWRDSRAIPDGLWTLILVETGFFGLAALVGTVLMPSILFLRRYPVRTWAHPSVAPGAILSIVLALYMLDCIQNAMINPVYISAMGRPNGGGGAKANAEAEAD